MGLASKPLPYLTGGVSQKPPYLRHFSEAAVLENGYPSTIEGLKKRPASEFVAEITAVATGAFIHTSNRDGNEKYKIVITNGNIRVYGMDGSAKTLTTPSGTSYLNSSNPVGDFSVVSLLDYTFIVNKTVTTALTAATYAGTNKGQKQRYADLPTTGNTAGDIWQIVGDLGVTTDNYYVKWSGSYWVECPAPAINYQIDAATMPWKLVRNADGTFTFDKFTWNDRVCGDLTTVPNPYFIGRKINEVFYFKNRLGFLSDEKIDISRAGDYFNFFPSSVVNALDSDPISIGVSYAKVSILRHAVPFQNVLVLISDATQFILSSNGPLTPSTVSLTPATEIQVSKACKPVASGSNLYLPVERGSYFNLREYFVYPNGVRYDSNDVTEKVQKYVPGGAIKMAAYTADDTVFVLSTGDQSSLYVFRSEWNGEKRTQQAWCKWTFDSTILNIDVVDTYLYLIMNRNSKTYLERINLQPGLVDSGLPYHVHLDHRVTLAGTYSSVTGVTTFTVPYLDSTVTANTGFTITKVADSHTGSTTVGSGVGASSASASWTAGASNTTVTVNGDWSSGTCVVGVPYKFKFTMSPQYLKDQEGVPIDHSTLKLRNITFVYADTGFFEVLVTPYLRDTYTYRYTGDNLGTSTLTLAQPAVSSGKFTAPVMSDGETVTITIQNSTHMPCKFQAAEWEGFTSVRSQRLSAN